MSTTLTDGGDYENKFLKYQASAGNGDSSVGKPDATGEPLIMANKLTGENACIEISTLATLA